MSFFMNIIDVLFIMGLLYGVYTLFPKGVKERTSRVFLEGRSPEAREEGFSQAQAEEAHMEAGAPEDVMEEEPPGPESFQDYVKMRLNEGLAVVERIAPDEPDLLVESRNFKEMFYIETMYLPGLMEEGGRQGLRLGHLDDYRELREASGRDIFFVVGLGGTETGPEILYIIPLDFAEDFIPAERLKKFERPEPDLPIMYYYKRLR